MSAFWQRLLGRVGIQPKEPTAKEVLVAHIVALLERAPVPSTAASQPNGEGASNVEGADARSEKVHLSVVSETPSHVLKVEAGLFQLELRATSLSQAVLRILGEGFFSESIRRRPADELRSLFTSQKLERPTDSAHFQTLVSVGTPEARNQVADRIETLLQQLSSLPTGAAYSVSIELDRPPDNSELISSIKELAKSKEFESRRVVYQNIINAWFYLPVQRQAPTVELPAVHPWPHEFDGKPVWAVFTDLSALQAFRSQPEPYVVISGIRLVQAAVSEPVGALKINPRSRIGGELYAHELQTLGDYLTKLGIRS